ncbi:MAG: hypothetical protein QXU32_03555 [Nitrososphaerales archaeon]
MNDRLKEIINAKINDIISKPDEIFTITKMVKDLIDDEEQVAFGIALGRVYNAFHYQTRRILKRNATKEEFNEFVELLSEKTESIKLALHNYQC